MNRKQDTAYGIKRIESKNARAAIIQKIAADFNLMPIMPKPTTNRFPILRTTLTSNSRTDLLEVEGPPQANTSS